METFNYAFDNEENFENYLKEIKICKDKPVLVRIHSSEHNPAQMEELTRYVKKCIPKAEIIGCSTTQVICEGRILPDTCLISISEFDNCQIETRMFSGMDEEGKWKTGRKIGEEVSQNLIRGRKGFLLIFFPLAYGKVAEFVEYINENSPGVRMLGGGAYCEDKPKHGDRNGAYVVSQSQVEINGVAAAFLEFEEIHIYQNVICGAECVGKGSKITKTNQYAIAEVDNIDGATWYADMLGREELEKDTTLSNVFPIVSMDEEKIPYYVDYEMIPKKDDMENQEPTRRLVAYCELPEGMKISLGYFAPQKIADQMRDMYRELRDVPTQSIFAYDCHARIWLLHNCAKWEVGQFYTTNISGALLSGEICHQNGRNTYANYTFAIASFSENETSHLPLKSRELRDVSALQQDNMKMINYLLAMGNKHLTEELTEQQGSMQNAVTYHQAVGIDNHLKYFFDRENKKLDKIAVFSLENAKMIKLFVGRKQIYNELKSIYKTVKEKYVGRSYNMYSYEDTSLLIAAGEEVTEAEFEDRMRSLLEYMNSIECQDIKMVYKCAMIVNDKNPLQMIDKILQFGKAHKMDFVKYSDVAELVEGTKQEFHVLQVLKDALVHERIVPFFQGIHDNREDQINLYESLIRIKDEEGKIYYPNQFLPVARDYNLYETLSAMMIKKVMEAFSDKDTKVTINLNVRDIYDRDVLKIIFGNLEKAKHPENFVFEVVESEEITNYEYVKQFADKVHESGAQIAIDDFGSGFSNFIHLMKIDADYLKIDGEIIRMMIEDKNCYEFVEFINEWCKKQGKEVVAEYVENKEIQDIMEKMGIRFSQGYYFSKPKPWEEVQADS